MGERITLADLTAEHLNRRVRVYSDRLGTISGDLRLVFQLDEIPSTNVSLWRGGRCVQDTLPNTTPCEVLE